MVLDARDVNFVVVDDMELFVDDEVGFRIIGLERFGLVMTCIF